MMFSNGQSPIPVFQEMSAKTTPSNYNPNYGQVPLISQQFSAQRNHLYPGDFFSSSESSFQVPGMQTQNGAHKNPLGIESSGLAPAEQRKAQIIQHLVEERQRRRQYVEQGRGDQFQVESLTQAPDLSFSPSYGNDYRMPGSQQSVDVQDQENQSPESLNTRYRIANSAQPPNTDFKANMGSNDLLNMSQASITSYERQMMVQRMLDERRKSKLQSVQKQPDAVSHSDQTNEKSSNHRSGQNMQSPDDPQLSLREKLENMKMQAQTQAILNQYKQNYMAIQNDFQQDEIDEQDDICFGDNPEDLYAQPIGEEEQYQESQDQHLMEQIAAWNGDIQDQSAEAYMNAIEMVRRRIVDDQSSQNQYQIPDLKSSQFKQQENQDELVDFGDPSELYEQDQFQKEILQKDSQFVNSGQVTSGRQHTAASVSRSQMRRQVQSSPNPEQRVGGGYPQLDNKPHSGNPSQNYLDPTIGSQMRSNNEKKRKRNEKSREFIQKADEKFRQDHTFQPKINGFKQDKNETENKTGMTKEERWKRLTEPNRDKIKQRDQAKAMKEIEEIQQFCPFRPQIETNKRSSSVRRSVKDQINQGDTSKLQRNNSFSGKTNFIQDSVPLADRLMHEADKRKIKREKLKLEKEMQEMEECSFQPNLDSSKSLINRHKIQQPPIYQRVEQIQKEKNERLMKLRVQAEIGETENKFKPQINSQSDKIAQIKQLQDSMDSRMNITVTERLYQDANQRIEKSMRQQMTIRNIQNIKNEENDPHTFHPAISDLSKIMVGNNEMYRGENKDFQTRQREFIARQMEKREQLRSQYSEEAVYSFKPKINLTSQVICASDPDRGNESTEAQINRLYNQDLLRRQIGMELKNEQLAKQCTFQPKINPISAKIAPETSIIERSDNIEAMRRREQLRMELEEKYEEECTFKPKINLANKKKYETKTSTYAPINCVVFSEQLKEQQKEREEKATQLKKEKEYEEVKDCTFVPKVNKGMPNFREKEVEIKGLGRVLELKELQRRKEEEIKLRQAEVFGLNHKFAVNAPQCDLQNPVPSNLFPIPEPKPRKGIHDVKSTNLTVPEPFELETEKRAMMREREHHFLENDHREDELLQSPHDPSSSLTPPHHAVSAISNQEMTSESRPFDQGRLTSNQFTQRNNGNIYDYPHEQVFPPNTGARNSDFVDEASQKHQFQPLSLNEAPRSYQFSEISL